MAEKRKEIIKHKVLNEKTGKVETVEKEFIYNESPDRKIKYITRQWCEDQAAIAGGTSRFYTDLSNHGYKYEYENEHGETTPIIAIAGAYDVAGNYVYNFTKPNGEKFTVVIENV